MRDVFGRWWAVAASLAFGCLLGVATSFVLRVPPRRSGDVTGALGALRRAESEAAGPWKRFAMRLGNFQGRLIMALFYYAVLTPFALVARLGFTRSRRAARGWIARIQPPASVERARRQF